MARPARGGRSTPADQILDSDETSLLDVVDNALTKGVVLNGELTLALAHVDLVYARLSVLLCAADPMVEVMRANDEPLFVMDENPTAENIAVLIWIAAQKGGLHVTEVRVWETATSRASYTGPAWND